MLLTLVGLGLFWIGSPLLPLRANPQEQVFQQAWETVNENFFDPNFNGVNWSALRKQYQPLVAQTRTRTEAATVINQMLAELKTSHTRFYTPDETGYYQLLGIFQPPFAELPAATKQLFPNRKFEYTGIGLFTRDINGETFISGILEGSPAAAADLKLGDRLVSVAGRPYEPIQSFAGKAGQPVELVIQRTPKPESQRSVTVTPKVFDAVTMFREAQRQSTRILENQGKKIGYVHIWSNAADLYQQQLREDLFYERLRNADGLVLDLRDGWGGGSTAYLNLFTGESPSITSIGRNGRSYTVENQWKKPVVMLINEGSRSAKEIVAYGFQQLKVGTLVGNKTAGAVVAGRPFFMDDGSMLYVAVANVLVDGNQRLEGQGVTPDLTVPFPLEYAEGSDPQKEQAIAALFRP